jgi:hypothetical protein
MAEKVELTAEEADALKRESAEARAPKIWRVTVRPDPAAAVNYVNLAPPQGAGEAAFSNRSDGQVDVYFYL